MRNEPLKDNREYTPKRLKKYKRTVRMSKNRHSIIPLKRKLPIYLRKKESQRQWNRTRHWLSLIFEYMIFSLFVLGCLWLLFRTSTHFVDGNSMSPTLKNGDRLLVHNTQMFQRYDLITFEPRDEKGVSYIKRIIGIPGDRVEIYEERLLLFPKGTEEKEEWQVGELPDSTHIFEVQEQNAVRTFQRVKQIPKDYYLVVGDNRKNSRDSRAFGLVHKTQIEGTVLLRYAPFSQFGIVH